MAESRTHPRSDADGLSCGRVPDVAEPWPPGAQGRTWHSRACSRHVPAEQRGGIGQRRRGPPTRQVRGWKIERVFDISQTDGAPLPDVAPARLNGDAPKGLWDGLAAQVGAAGFALLREAPERPS